jgi:type I restriction-modification system DNA methylase subunit
MSKTKKSGASTVDVSYEAQLWQMADAPRRGMDTAQYKDVVLGFIFLKI